VDRHQSARRPPGATAALASPCSSRARAALAAAAAIPPASIAATPFTASSGAASCRFTAALPPAGRLEVAAELDSAPQAYYRLERQIVETGQNVIWEHQPESAYPVRVAHLGLDAAWFAGAGQLATTDGVRLVTVVVAAGPPRAGRRELIATRLARAYLGRLVEPRH